MEKLSTAELKKMITVWLSTPEARKNLEHHSEDEVEEAFLWKKWCDGSQWRRHEKRKLKDCWTDYFVSIEYVEGQRRKVPRFAIDMMGHAENSLLLKFFNDPKLAEKCILRVFLPNDESLGDCYRLEVVTTPEDNAVIGWTVIVD